MNVDGSMSDVVVVVEPGDPKFDAAAKTAVEQCSLLDLAEPAYWNARGCPCARVGTAS